MSEFTVRSSRGKLNISKKKNLDQGLKSWEVSDIKKKQALFQQKSHMCEVGGAQPPKGAPLFVILLLYPLTTLKKSLEVMAFVNKAVFQNSKVPKI